MVSKDDNKIKWGRLMPWQYRWAWFPRRSTLSGRLIWFNFAYRGTRFILSPGGGHMLAYWITVDEYLMEKLKGTVL